MTSLRLSIPLINCEFCILFHRVNASRSKRRVSEGRAVSSDLLPNRNQQLPSIDGRDDSAHSATYSMTAQCVLRRTYDHAGKTFPMSMVQVAIATRYLTISWSVFDLSLEGPSESGHAAENRTSQDISYGNTLGAIPRTFNFSCYL